MVSTKELALIVSEVTREPEANVKTYAALGCSLENGLKKVVIGEAKYDPMKGWDTSAYRGLTSTEITKILSIVNQN